MWVVALVIVSVLLHPFPEVIPIAPTITPVALTPPYLIRYALEIPPGVQSNSAEDAGHREASVRERVRRFSLIASASTSLVRVVL